MDDDNLGENVHRLSRVVNELIESGVASDPVLRTIEVTPESRRNRTENGSTGTLKADEFMGFSIAGGSTQSLVAQVTAHRFHSCLRGDPSGSWRITRYVKYFRIGLPQATLSCTPMTPNIPIASIKTVRQFLVASAVTDLSQPLLLNRLFQQRMAISGLLQHPQSCVFIRTAGQVPLPIGLIKAGYYVFCR